jgi:hypothetical protein
LQGMNEVTAMVRITNNPFCQFQSAWPICGALVIFSAK